MTSHEQTPSTSTSTSIASEVPVTPPLEVRIKPAPSDRESASLPSHGGLLQILVERLPAELLGLAKGPRPAATDDRLKAMLWNLLAGSPKSASDVAETDGQSARLAIEKARPGVNLDKVQNLVDQVVFYMLDGVRYMGPSSFKSVHGLLKSTFELVDPAAHFLVESPSAGGTYDGRALPPGAGPAIDRILAGHEAAFLLLHAVATDMQIASAGGGSPRDAALARILHQTFLAAFTDSAFVIDARVPSGGEEGAAQAMKGPWADFQSALAGLTGRGLMLDPVVLVDETGMSKPMPKWMSEAMADHSSTGIHAESVPTIDEKSPLDLFQNDPAVKQTLDRTNGEITLSRPGEPSDEVRIQISPLPADGTADHRLRQDREIRFLSDFLQAHFTVEGNRLTFIPPRLKIAAGALRAGTLVLARETDGRWSVLSTAVKRTLAALNWSPAHGPRTYLSVAELLEGEDTGQSDLDPPDTESKRQPDPDETKSPRIVLQMEDDGAITSISAGRRWKHMDEVAWVKVPENGPHEIVVGKKFLDTLTEDTAIKVEIIGHGGRWERSAKSALGGYGAEELAGKVVSTLRALSVKAPIGKFVLLACQLESPVYEGSFSEEFLKAIGKSGIATSTATVTAYSRVVFSDGAESRRTMEHIGASPISHGPESTYEFQLDLTTGMVTRRDKYPEGSASQSESDAERAMTGEMIRAQKRFLRRPRTSQDHMLAPDSGESVGGQAGRAGRIHEVLSALDGTLTRSAIAKVAGPAPVAVSAAVRDRLTLLAGKLGLDAAALQSAADEIADGLWQRDTVKLYAGFAELSRRCNDGRPRYGEMAWDLRPQGLVSKVKYASQLVDAYPDRALLPAAEIVFMRGLDAGLHAMDDGVFSASSDRLSHAWGRQTRVLVSSALSGRPFVIDVDEVRRMSASDMPADLAGLKALEVLHAAARKLTGQGVIEAPIYMSEAEQSTEAGWTTYKDGSSVNRGDLLPLLRPERKAAMDVLQIPGPAVDDGRPLSRLGAFLPAAIQTLDRAAGTIRIAWPKASNTSQADTLVAFAWSRGGPGSDDRALQDADIRALDDFLVGAFFHWTDWPLNSMPAKLTLEGTQLKAARLELATRAEGRWTANAESFHQLREFLLPRRWPATPPSKPVARWNAELGFDESGMYFAPSEWNRRGAKLRVILQMEDDPILLDVARQDIIRHPGEAVWIQVGADGDPQIRYGKDRLTGLPDRVPVKLDIYGHGGHDAATRSQTLANYRSLPLVGRVRQVVEHLGLLGRVKQVTLTSCALEAPMVEESFGEEFLREAIGSGMVADDATLVAYGELLHRQSDLDDVPSRGTFAYKGGPEHSHVDGVTWLFKKSPVSGVIERTSKHSATTSKSSDPELGLIEKTHDHVHGDGSRGGHPAERGPRDQWGSAGSLRELFRILDRVAGRSGMDVLDGAVPATLTEAIQASLRQAPSTGADAGPDFAIAAEQIATGLWNRDPMALYDGFSELSFDCNADATAKVAWGDLPRGMVNEVRFPSRMLAAFESEVVLPAAEAGFLKALDAGLAAMKKMAIPVDLAPDDTGRIALAQQTGDLVHSLLSGRPFVVEVDLVSNQSPSGMKRKAGTTTLDVLEVALSASRHLARQGIMSESIYMTEAATWSGPGWETYPDGSRVNRGDLLPDLLRDRVSSINRLREPFSRPVDDAAPLARLKGFMPKAIQSLDRGKGTLTIKWPGNPPRQQADSVLSFRPLDEGSGEEGRRLQDADIQALDEFIVSAFFDSVGTRQNATPSRLNLTEGVLTASKAVLARRVNDGWLRDTGVVLQTRAVLGKYVDRAPATGVSTWKDGLGDALKGKDGAATVIGKKLRLHVQIEDDETILGGARRVVRNHPDEVVWIQMDRHGKHRIIYGAHLLEQVRPDLPVKITIEGHGGHDEFTRSQVFAGFTANELADGLATLVASLKLESRARQGMLLGCSLVAPMVASDYAEQFLDVAIRKGVLHADAELTAYAAAVTMVDDLDLDFSPSKKTRRFRGEASRHHVPETTWSYKRQAATERVVRTDKHPAAGSGDAYGLDTVHTIDSEEARNPRPGRAGELCELFDTLAATQTKGGFTKRAGNAPDAVVEAVQEKLRTLFLELEGVSESDLHAAARSMADGVWQRDPAKIQEGYVKLSALCAVDSGHVAKVTWSDRPIGVVDRVTVPSQLRLTYDTFVSMPLPDAALAHGLQATVAGMDGLSLDAQADAGSRAFARQTLALTEAVLSGQPFTVDADAVFRMSTSKDVDARATLDVLDITHATAMQLASRDVMAAPIYLTDARRSPDVGWERYPDGSLVHRGDILPNILPERAETMERLRTPMAIAVDETRPLPRLARFMPEATQTLDRQAGTVTITWPEMTDGPQARSVLSFAPSDAGAGTDGRRLQDADILAMDDFILREFFPSAGPVRNSLPAQLSLDGNRLIAGRSVLAERQGARWVRDSAAMREALSILSPRPVTPSASRPATSWHGELGDAITGLKVADQGSRLLVHLQMEDDLVMLHGARRTIRNHPEETVWIQVDRDGNHVIRHGAELLQRAAPDLPVKIEISGHGSHDPETRTQQLARYDAIDLAKQLAPIIEKLELTSRAKNLTLVSCAIEAPVVSDSFGATFLKAAIDQKIVRQDATVVAYGEVLVRNNQLERTQPSRKTRRHPDARPEKHAPGVTWQFKKDAATGTIVRTDKYPAGSADDGLDADDDDSALKRLADFREEAYEARAASIEDRFSGHTLPMNGIDVPLTFLASLGAQIDGQPLTADRLHAIADLPGDPVARLKIDPELLEQWTSSLSDQPDAEVSDRIRALGGWLDGRKGQSGAEAAFTGEAPSETRAIVDRLTSASNADAVGDGHALSDAELLKAARGEKAGPTSLLGEILQEVSASTRSDFEDWLTRTGQSLDDLKDMAPSRPGGEADTPVEKVVKAIERRVKGDDGIDFDKMVRVDKGNAIAALQEIGVVRAHRHGLRLDASRLKAYIDRGDGVKLAYAGRALRKMSGKAYRALLDSAPDSVRPFMKEMRGLPSAGKAVGRKISAGFNKVSDSIDYIDTVQGIYQILGNWDAMSPTQKGLSIVQSSGFVLSPLARMAGQALSKLAPVARSAVLSGACAGLGGHVANVSLSVIGLVSCGLELKALVDSGQTFDSYAGKSAIANTVMACASFALATANFVVGVAVVLAKGAVIAGTALSAASSVLGAIAAPVAIVMFITNAVVQAALWFEEFGQYIREGTSLDDKALAGFAKAFGFSTDVTRRAEVEQAARQAAARLSQSLKAQLHSDLEFEGKLLAKQGYNRLRIPDTEQEVNHATFYDPESAQQYNFALQPGRQRASQFRVFLEEEDQGPTKVAWLSMDHIRHDSQVVEHQAHESGHHLFQVGNLVNARVTGWYDADRFLLRKTDGVHVWGQPAHFPTHKDGDEIEIDAEGSDLMIRPAPLEAFVSSMSVTYPQLRETKVHDIRQWMVRNGGEVNVIGSASDERFDVSGRVAKIHGAKGRNTYVVRNGNHITVTSTDVAIWTRGVSGAVIDLGNEAAELVLKVDVLHESLSFRRDGLHLDVLIGEESLKLEKYFEPLARPSPGPLPDVTFVDAVGTVVVLIEPGKIKAETVSVTELDKHLVFSTELPDSRRTFSGDNALNQYHLSSGSGHIRVLPMTGKQMSLFLNVPVERLGLREEGEDLVIVETPPADALATFAPLRLRLSGQRRSDSDEPDQNVTVRVKEQDKAPALLVLPKPGKAVDATVSVVTPAKAATPTSATNGKSSDAGQGTDGPDVIDARALTDGTVLRGGFGADTYRVKAGQTLVIDNRAADGALDVLELEGVDWFEFLKSHQFSRSGGDLVIRMARGQITVRDHGARSDARHLSIHVGDKRFALPVIEGGFMVHLPSSKEGDVPAMAPGVHLIQPERGEAWSLTSTARKVWMRHSTRQIPHGTTVEAVVKGDRPSTVMLVGYHRAPEDWDLTEFHFRQDGSLSGGIHGVRCSGASDTSPLFQALVDSTAGPGDVYPLTKVKDYLQLRGMPKEVASQIRSDTVQRLQRLHHLLAVAVDSKDWLLPAVFIDAYTESDLTPSADQGPMIRFLASRSSPWAYDEVILSSKLTMTQLEGFESWASVHAEDKLGSPKSVEDLTAFIQMLKGEKPPTVKPSLLAKVLELKGRPTAVAQQLALAMHAADTLDDAWVAGMLQAGVIHHDVLRRLKDAGVSPQDVVLGNANRLRYEGSEDRSAFIGVDTSSTFKSESTLAFRYTLNYYLKLDAAGEYFSKDSTPQPGVVYDLVPGVIVDENGESPNPDLAESNWTAKYFYTQEELEKCIRSPFACVDPAVYLMGRKMKMGTPPLSSVVRLKKQGLASCSEYKTEPGWEGRSTPGNLVDGIEGHDEVAAWRPFTPILSSDDDKSKSDISIDADKYIEFAFAHPVALTHLDVKIANLQGVSDIRGQIESGSLWEVYAQRKNGTWVEVGYASRIYPGDTLASWLVDTKGVPYSRYRLTGISGAFPKSAWFSEVVFRTREIGVGIDDMYMVAELQRAGYDDEQIRSLFLHGLRDEWHAQWAVDLRRHFGPLPAAAVVEDVQLHDSLNQAEIKILNDLRTGQGESTGWSPEALLKAVRVRAVDRHIDLLNLRLPFLEEVSVEDEEHRGISAALKEGSKDTSSDPTTDPLSWMPDWLKGSVALSPRRERTGGDDQVDLIRHALARTLVDALHARLAKSVGEPGAKRVTAPWYLHLAALTAAASSRDLRLRIGPTNDQAVDAVIKSALPRLQAAYDEGLLKVSIASQMPPVGSVKPWAMSARDGETWHLSPGTALVTEYGEARNGLPISRLKAGGFTDVEAKSLFDRGIKTLDQVMSAIDWRALFPALSWRTVADGVLYDATREPISGSDATGSSVRGQFTQAQLAELIDGRLSIDAPRLFSRAMARAHVLQVRGWLDAMGPSTANLQIAAQLTHAAGGVSGALSSAIGLAVKQGLLHHGASTVTEASAWAPSTLRGFVSLEPPQVGATARPFDAPVFNILNAYEQLLDTLGQKLDELGYAKEAADEALRPNYLELAVIRAAIAGQRLRLHVPAGGSAREQAFVTMIEAWLTHLQPMDAFDVVDVCVDSSMPPVDAPDVWKTEVADGKTRHLSPEFSLEAWRRAKDGQAIPRLKAGGFSGDQARHLYSLGVRTPEHVSRAIALREEFRRLPPEIIANDVALPPLPVDTLRYAGDLGRYNGMNRSEEAKLFAAVRGGKVKVLHEIAIDVNHLPSVERDLIRHTYGNWYPIAEDSPVRDLLSNLKKSMIQSLPHLNLETTPMLENLAWTLFRTVQGTFAYTLRDVILQLQWLHVHHDVPSDVAVSPPWAPRRLQEMASLGAAGKAGHVLAAPTAAALRAFELLLETLDAELRQRGYSEASVTQAMGPHFLRLTALHATASGRQLRLHVPPTGAPADRELRDILDLAIPFLEKARSAGLVDVAIASARSPVNPETAWTTEEMDGKVLHVSSTRPLESAWDEARRSYPFHRLTAAGYGDDEAQQLLDGGIDTIEREDRAIQLRGLFDGLAPEAVLKDVLEEPSLDEARCELASRLGHRRTEFGALDRLRFVRQASMGDARLIKVSDSLPHRFIKLAVSDSFLASLDRNLRAWLSKTQGPTWAAHDAAVTLFVDAMCNAVLGGIGTMTTAFHLAQGLGLRHQGQATAVDRSDWMIGTVGAHAKLRPAEGGDAWPAMTASDYIVLKGYQRLLDVVFKEWSGFHGEDRAAQDLGPFYLQLQVLRAVATGQHLDLLEPVGDSDQARALRGAIQGLREPLEQARSAGLLKVSFLPAASDEATHDTSDLKASEVLVQGDGSQRTRRSVDDTGAEHFPAEDARRLAALMTQDMATRRDLDAGGSSSFGTHPPPSRTNLLSAPVT